jgi:hypothetical protein
MTKHFRDQFEIVAESKDESGNAIILFKDTSIMSDAEMCKCGVDENSPIYGVKTVYDNYALPVPREAPPGTEPEIVSGVDVVTERASRAVAQNVYDALTA